jgi:hypothetical protein
MCPFCHESRQILKRDGAVLMIAKFNACVRGRKFNDSKRAACWPRNCCFQITSFTPKQGRILDMNVALSSLLAALVCSQTPECSHQTANFVVYAETAEVAKMVADSAEGHRQEIAKLWHGKKLADWSKPCRIDVALTMNGPQGCTEITYFRGQVAAHKIDVKGALNQILKGPLPHEVTHVLLGHHFGSQVPRWADEGAAILSEDESQAVLQQKAFAAILTAEKQFPLRPFLAMQEYPSDLRCLYAQGHSVSRFLVSAKGRPTLLAFVSDGLRRGWDEAVREQYGYKDVEDLEAAWLDSLRPKCETGIHRLVDPFRFTLCRLPIVKTAGQPLARIGDSDRRSFRAA